MVGLPTKKFEDDTDSGPTPLFSYQKRILNKYRESHYYAQNKCRGAGTSELLTVRWNAFKMMTAKSIGRKSLVIAGVNLDQAKIFMNRIKTLCDKIPKCYLFEPRSEFPTQIFFKQGGSIWALPASVNAVRSLENVEDVFYEEFAFWKLVDDKPVLKAGEPHVIKSKAHVNLISTPAGKMRFFWENVFDPECSPPTKYNKHVLNWREVVGVPEPNPEVLTDMDFSNKPELDKAYIKRYDTDLEYKQWFDSFFPGRTIQDITSVSSPIIDIKEIVNLYNTDRANYEQEFDNQFILSENRAFGEFEFANVASDNFEEFTTF